MDCEPRTAARAGAYIAPNFTRGRNAVRTEDSDAICLRIVTVIILNDVAVIGLIYVVDTAINAGRAAEKTLRFSNDAIGAVPGPDRVRSAFHPPGVRQAQKRASIVPLQSSSHSANFCQL